MSRNSGEERISDMSKALKCDRCGSFYIPDDSHQKRNRVSFFKFNYDNVSYSDRVQLDLCPRCADRLESWLDRPSGLTSIASNIVN